MYKIDPYNITRFDRTDNELQAFMLFTLAVAGKTAYIIAGMLDSFLCTECSPFEYVKSLNANGLLLEKLKESKIGMYGKLCRAYPEVVNANLDLRTCTTEDLEKIYGVGPKTSRFFLLHSRPDQKIACIDTHLLKWLNQKGYPLKAPNNKKKYRQIEEIFLNECEKLGKTPHELDLEIWKSLARIAPQEDNIDKIDTISQIIVQ
jgi:thermostable 8-oxoguanine DNA glycosylase